MEVTPMTFTPMTNIITSANVKGDYHGRINLYLRVLHRRAAVKDTSTASFLTISGKVDFRGLAYSFSSIINRVVARHVRVANEGFLARANHSAQFCRVCRVAWYNVHVVQVATNGVTTYKATSTMMIGCRQVFFIQIGVEQ